LLRYNWTHTDLYSPFPLYAKIEINGDCNLDCVICRRTQLPNRNQRMSLQQFEIILQKMPSLVLWSPHGYNEPLLHPQFYDFIRLANKYNILLVLVTNGTLLTPTETEKLLSLKPHKVRFSIDAIGKEYERIRQGASWEKVYHNVKYFAKRAKETGVDFYIYATIWEQNLTQIPQLIMLATELETRIAFTDITYSNEYRESIEDHSIREHFDQTYYEQFIGPIKYYKDNPRVQWSLEKRSQRSCTLPWAGVYIDVIGDIHPCTDNLQWTMGNIFTDDIQEVFNSERYRKFRLMSLDGSNANCRKCVAWAPMKQ